MKSVTDGDPEGSVYKMTSKWCTTFMFFVLIWIVRRRDHVSDRYYQMIYNLRAFGTTAEGKSEQKHGQISHISHRQQQ